MPGNIEEKEKCLEKLNQMQKYLPFLDFMIDKIKKKNNEISLECQLSKFQLLRSMIAEKNWKYAWDVIVKVEDVIEKLITKLGYKEQYKKSKENVKDKSRIKESQVLTWESNEMDVKSGMAASLTIIPSSTTTTISVTSASSSQVTTVNSKSQDSSSNAVDLIMKKLKLSVENSLKKSTDNETGKEFLSASLGPNQSFEDKSKSDISGKSMETDLDKDLDGFDLTDCPNLSETDSSHLSAESVVVPEKPKSSHDDLLSSSREKLLKSLQSRLFPPRKPDRSSSQSCEVKAAEKASDSSAFSQSRTPTNTSERKGKSDFTETGRHSDSDKVDKGSRKTGPLHVMSPKSVESSVSENKNRGEAETESSLKQKLRQKLSADICEVYRVSGKSVGGSLRSLKETRDHKRKSVTEEEEEEELFKPDKITGGVPIRSSVSRPKSCESRETEKHRTRESSPKKGEKKREKSTEKSLYKVVEKSERHETKQEKHSKAGGSKSDKNERREKSSGESKKTKKVEKKFEIESMDDNELLDFVKENMQSLPHLSKLKPVELRKVVQSSLMSKSIVPGADEISSSSEDSFQDLDEFMNNMGDMSEKFTVKESTDEGKKSIKNRLDENSTVAKGDSDGPTVNKTDADAKLGAGEKSVEVDSVSCDEDPEEEDYAQKLIDETTPHMVVTKKKKGLLELPMPSMDDFFDEVSSGEDEKFEISRLKSSKDVRDPRRKPPPDIRNKPPSDPRMIKGSKSESICDMNRGTSHSLPTSHFNPNHKESIYSSRPQFASQNLDNYCGRMPRSGEEKVDSWHLKPIASQDFNNFPHFRFPIDMTDPLLRNPNTFPHMVPSCHNEPPRRNSYHSEPKSYAEYKRLKLIEKQRLSLQEAAQKDVSQNNNTADENVNTAETPRPPVEKDETDQSTLKPGEKKDSRQSRPVPKPKVIPKGNNSNPVNRSHDDRRNQGQRRYTDHTENKDYRERKSFHEDDSRRKKIGSDKRLSSDSEEIVSPLEKLYQGEEKPKTGRGYGIQNFKIPKKIRDPVSHEFKPNDKLPVQKDSTSDNSGKESSKASVSSSLNEVQTSKEEESKTQKKEIQPMSKPTKMKPPERIEDADEAPLKTGVKATEEKNSSLTDSLSEIVTVEEKKDIPVVTKESQLKDNVNVIEETPKADNIAEEPKLAVPEEPAVEVVKETPKSRDSAEQSKVDHKPVQECEAQTVECDSGVESPSVTNVPSGKDSNAPREKSTVVTKEEITQEFVEALIRKSFQSGEGKLLLAQAKLFEEFARKLNSKKLKTIQKIINSESGSSSSSSDSSSEDEKKKRKSKKSEEGSKERTQKSRKRKKKGRRSRKHKSSSSSSSSESEDSSDDETLDKFVSKKTEKSDTSVTPSSGEKRNVEVEETPNEAEPEAGVNLAVKTTKKRRRGIDFGRCISRRRATRKQGQKKLLEQILNEGPQQEVGVDSNLASPGEVPVKESEPKTKPRGKGKSKTELDRLHDDIRSMFISSGVVTATGQRMCRILKESGGNMNNLDIVKESAKMVEEQKLKKVLTRTPRLRKPKARAKRQGNRSRSESLDMASVRDRSTSGSRENQQELTVSENNFELPKNEPYVVLQRVDLNNFGYGVKISDGCIRFRRSDGRNRAIRGRRWMGVSSGKRSPNFFLPLEISNTEVSSNNLGESLESNLAKNVYLERNKRKCERLKNKKCKKGYFGKNLEDIVKKLPLKMAKMKHLEICARKKEEKSLGSKKWGTTTKGKATSKNEKKWKIEEMKDADWLTYAFEKKKSVYTCKLCSHVTRNITGHYTAVHPESEVLISRLCLSEAWKAIAEAKEIAKAENSPEGSKRKSKAKSNGSINYHCRMCTNRRTTDLNAFFTHVTTHTGEYIFHCPAEGCPVRMSTRDYIKFHILTKHPHLRYELYSKITEQYKLPVEGENVFGFLCSMCHFVQISRKNVEDHISKRHPSVKNVQIIKIDMCSNTARKEKMPKGWQVLSQKEETPSKEESQKDVDKNSKVEESGKMEQKKRKQRSESGQGEVKLPEAKKLLRVTEGVGRDDDDQEDEEDDEYETSVDVNVDELTGELDGNVEVDDCPDLKNISTIRGSDIIEPIENADKKEPECKNPDSGTSTKLKVGPLEAQLVGNTVALYECYVKGCLFSTKVFDLFEKHLKISHWKSKWDGKCEICSSRGDHQVFPRYTKLLFALKHLRAHERETIRDGNVGVDMKLVSYPLHLMKTDECNNSGEESHETLRETEHLPEEGEGSETVPKTENNEAPYPVKPLLRVRNLLGDRLSRQKESVEEEDEIVEIEDSGGVETQENNSMMFTIENVRSLIPESESEDVEIEIEKVRPKAIVKEDQGQKAQLVQGNPVIVRSCPTPKITLRPEPPGLSPFVEVGHITSPPAQVLLSPQSSSMQVLSTTLRRPRKTKFSVQRIVVSAPSFVTPSPNLVSVLHPTPASVPLTCDTSVTPVGETDTTADWHDGQSPTGSRRQGRSPVKSPSEKEDPDQKKSKSIHRLYSRPDIKNKSVKDVKIYQEMLTKKKLCHLFKCMAVECSFTCNNEVVFTQHIGLHEAQRRVKNQRRGGKGFYIESGNKMKKVYNWQQCAYCCEVLVNTSSALSQHILTEHGHCIYQCAYCFYRALTQSYVEIHQNLAHSNILKTDSRVIYKCKPLSISPPLTAALEKHGRRQSVRPYQCDQCGSKFFITQEFMNHLMTQHVSVTAYTCHICKNLCFKADRLIVHYKLHSYCTYQCAYCLHGTETQKEMLFHLCNFHFSQPPYMYVRALADGQPSSDEVIKRPNKKKKSNSSQLDALKVVVYESDSLSPDCIVEADPDEENGDGTSRSSPSKDLSSIVAELGINTEGQPEVVSPLIKELACIGNKNTETLSVKTLLPNASFSSESENSGENCSVLISSGCSTSEQNEDKEMNIPLGQLPLEALNVQCRESSPSSSLPKNIGSPDKNLKINEIIVNLHNKDKTFPLPNTEEEKMSESASPSKPSSAVHKLPPVVLSRSSCPKKVYPPKTGNVVKKKAEESVQSVDTSDGNTILYRMLNSREEKGDSKEKTQNKERRESKESTGDENFPEKEKNGEESCGQPLITSVVSLAGHQKPVEVSKPNNESIIISEVCSLTCNIERSSFPNPSGLVINIQSHLNPPPSLKPPIIRVEDFPIGEDENRTDSGKVESGENLPKSDEPKTEAKAQEEEEAPLSPDIIILAEGKQSKDIETVILDSEDEKDESGAKEESSTSTKVPDDTIRKEMERLRNKIASETDSLLFDDSESGKPDTIQPLRIEANVADGKSVGDDNVLLSPIEEAISTLNKKLQSETTQAKEKEEDGKKNSETCINKPESVEGPKTDLPRTRSGARIRKEDDGEDGKKEETARNKQIFKTELIGKDLFICGNDKCNFSAESDSLLKDHLYVCDLSRESSMLVCPHCSKQFKHFHPYLEHVKYHGVKKYHCGICSYSSAVDMSLTRHVKQKHKCSAVKLLPKDPPKEGHYVCYPKNYRVEKGELEVNTYSPGDEDKLPLQSVYQVNVKCAKCPYFTKVRSNMVRHLKIHVKSVETEGVVVVPSTAPTNPVPCLEKKERMFDKMTNLAASSQLAQAKEKSALQTLSPEEEAKLPQFVAEQMRYKCCLPDCNYITIDDGMLKHHIKALHDEINYYSCPHCKSTVHVDVRHVTLDKIGHHLKHHDSKLYKCAHCIFFHYQKNVVEKHAVEKHPDRRFFVFTVREPKPDVASEEEHSSNEGGVVTWKCGLCTEFQSSSKSSLMEHLGKVHNTKSKYKCQFCFMKSNTYQAFFGHFASKHPGEKVQYVRSIIRISSANVEIQSGNSSGADSSNEHFDTTPLWQRGAPRVRHIRGILIEEEEVKTKKSKRTSVDTETEGEVSEVVTVKENAFCCPLCTDKKKVFYTRNEDCFRTHLYQELNYQQFACILCGKMFVDKKDFERHHAKVHPEKPPSMKQTKEDGEIMFWVDKVIAKQREQMKGKGGKRRLSESTSTDSQGPPKKKKEV